MKRNQSRLKSLVVWIVGLLLMLVTVSAQAKASQAPIIALYNNALYAVSAEDGTSRKLVEAPADQSLITDRYARMSPDGKWLMYALATNPDDFGIQSMTLFLLNLETGESTLIQPSGGIFDKPPRDGFYFEVAYPTWSADGSRLYYTRSAYDKFGGGKTDQIQLAYWDVKAQKHRLVARLEPEYWVFELTAFKGGILVNHMDRVGTVTTLIYNSDNRLLSQNELGNNYPVEYKGRDYFALPIASFEITSLIDVETGQEEPIGKGYHSAARSRLAGDQSMHILVSSGESNRYSIYGADYHDRVGEMTNVNYALSPDGQSAAFIAYVEDSDNLPSIQVMSMDGTLRTLPFKASNIFWGPQEQVAFYAPG